MGLLQARWLLYRPTTTAIIIIIIHYYPPDLECNQRGEANGAESAANGQAAAARGDDRPAGSSARRMAAA